MLDGTHFDRAARGERRDAHGYGDGFIEVPAPDQVVSADLFFGFREPYRMAGMQIPRMKSNRITWLLSLLWFAAGGLLSGALLLSDGSKLREKILPTFVGNRRVQRLDMHKRIFVVDDRGHAT